MHCFAHSLNLAVQDVTKSCSMIRDALNMTHEITKLVKASPKRENWLEKLKQEAPEMDQPGKLKRLSFTR